MKCLLCSRCLDVLRLQPEARTCRCGRSSGHYHAEHEVTLSGHALMLGLNSNELYRGARNIADGQKKPAKTDAHIAPMGSKNVKHVASGVRTCTVDEPCEVQE